MHLAVIQTTHCSDTSHSPARRESPESSPSKESASRNGGPSSSSVKMPQSFPSSLASCLCRLEGYSAVPSASRCLCCFFNLHLYAPSRSARQSERARLSEERR